MEKKEILIIVLAISAVVAVVLLTRKTPKGYAGQSTGNQEGVGGWWSGLWDNAANILDAGGRHTSSFVTSIGNTVSQIMATKNSGKYVEQSYGYSDEKNYGPYVLAGALIIAASVAGVLILKK